MKKLTATLCLLLTTLIALSACGGDAVELLAFIGEDTGDVDYGGYQFHFYSPHSNEDNILLYDKNSINGEAMLKRVQDIKDEMNVEIIFNTDYDHDTYMVIALSGTSKADAFSFDYMNAMQVFAKGGYLYPLTDFSEYIDLSDTDKYGAAPALEPAMVNSVPYAVRPCFWPGCETIDSFILAYNKDLTAANGITDFHEFWEAENWTWETYENEFLAKAQVETANGYIAAMSMVNLQYFSMLMYSNNVHFITKNDAGENVVTLYPEEFVHAYETGLDWATEYKNTIIFESGVYTIDKFLSEDSFTGLASASDITTGSVAYDANFNYGIMPFPAGPDATYGVWAQYLQRVNAGIGIAKTSEDPNIAAHTISAWLEPFEEFGSRNGFYEYYKENVFLTETDTDVYFALMENVRYDYSILDYMDIGRQMTADFGGAIKQGMGLAEAMDKNLNQMTRLVNDYILPNYDYMYENYYSKLEN